MNIQITTINIGATSKERAELFTDWFEARNDDVYILTEASGGEGTSLLLRRFRDAGYHVATNGEFGPERGTVIVSRIPFSERLTPTRHEVSIPCRAVMVALETDPVVHVLGLYIPSRDASAEKVQRKKVFLTSLEKSLNGIQADTRSSLIIGGDYNVVSRNHVPKYSTFLAFEYDFLDRLAYLGLNDTHLALHPDDQPHSWVGRTGDGYRYDYFHAGPDVLPHVVASEYLSSTRESKLTDHSAVRITVHAHAIRESTLPLRDGPSQTLFDF